MHFFNPVPVMALLELIRGLQTSDDTHAKALDFAKPSSSRATTSFCWFPPESPAHARPGSRGRTSCASAAPRCAAAAAKSMKAPLANGAGGDYQRNVLFHLKSATIARRSRSSGMCATPSAGPPGRELGEASSP